MFEADISFQALSGAATEEMARPLFGGAKVVKRHVVNSVLSAMQRRMDHAALFMIGPCSSFST